MTTAAVHKSEFGGSLGLTLVMALPILTDLWWPGSIGHTLARIAFFSYFAVWYGVKIRRGYSRRRPHWTRESWLRYLRLALMPVGAITLLFLLNAIDISLFGAPRSATRTVWIVIMLAMLLFGGLGFAHRDLVAGKGRADGTIHAHRMVPATQASRHRTLKEFEINSATPRPMNRSR